MRKKLLSLALALAVCLGLTVPAMATTYTENRGGITITLTSEPNENRVTISYTGSGKLTADHLEYAVELICYEIQDMRGDYSIWIEIVAGITSEMNQDRMSQVINEACPQWGLIFAGVNFGSAPQQPAGTTTTSPTDVAETYTDTYEGITVTAHSNGSVSYTGTGKLVAEHAEIGVNAFYMATDAAKSANTASISIEQGITMTGEFKERWNYHADDSGFSVSFNNSTTSTQPTTPAAETIASPTNDKLEVNGSAANPTVYKIGGSNYFKIRDVAALLNGTEKQFAVGYDGAKQSVTATTGQGYEKQSGDLAGAATGGNKTAAASNDAIYVDGQKITAEVYKIDGSNYFKLRDLGKALDFYVGWSADRGMYIETGKPYSE